MISVRATGLSGSSTVSAALGLSPRRTTPLAWMSRLVPIRYVPGLSTTAPRKPRLSRGSADTWSMAAWMSAVASPSGGSSFTAAGTSGIGAPPPP